MLSSCYGPLTKTRFTAHNFNPWLYGTVAFTMAYIFIITDANQVIDPHHIHDVSITGTHERVTQTSSATVMRQKTQDESLFWLPFL